MQHVQIANKPLRWLTLIIVILNVIFDPLYNYFSPEAPSIAAIAAKYDSLFVPAGYAFAIWGLIYLASLIYSVIQLLPAQQSKPVYDKLDVTFIIVNILGIAWEYTFRQEMILFSVVVISCMLIGSAVLFGQAYRAVILNGYKRWLTVPFSLYTGWLSVATIANVSLALAAGGWDRLNLPDTTWVMIMLGIALCIAIMFALIYRDAIYPLVIAWASFAIWINLKDVSAGASQAALGVAIASLLFAIFTVLRKRKTFSVQETYLK